MNIKDDAIVHLSVASSSGRSYYATACGLPSSTEWLTYNKGLVTCADCKAKMEEKK